MRSNYIFQKDETSPLRFTSVEVKVFDYYMCFNRIRPLRIGRGDLGVHRDFKIHNHFTEQSDC